MIYRKQVVEGVCGALWCPGGILVENVKYNPGILIVTWAVEAIIHCHSFQSTNTCKSQYVFNNCPPSVYIKLYIYYLSWCWSCIIISGPDFWGLVNPEWHFCSKGKKQSPVNVNPKHILYDPQLKHVHIDKHRVSAIVVFISSHKTLPNRHLL